MIAIHDPIHGTIEVTPDEIKLIDSRPFQRLRYIKQLGFSELAFPGATHSRYAHCLGAMQMATRIVDRALMALDLPNAEAQRVRETVRLAVLFHDLGHPPLSHVSEGVMPPVEELQLGAWVTKAGRQATHEDYTVKLLIDSELTRLLEQRFSDLGVTPARIAGVVVGQAPPGDPDAYRVGGLDLLPLLNQIVSSEMDADRMDYLRRDSYYCGVSYGNYDHIWLTNNVTAIEHEGALALALLHKGVWAFENFLLARYHMFLSVYYHHTAICFDHLLLRYYASGEYTLPADSEAYLECDDVHLFYHLRRSRDPWARLVVQRRPYRLLIEAHGAGDQIPNEGLDERLEAAGVDFFRVRREGMLSKYFRKRDQAFPLLVYEPEARRVSRIEDYTPLYRRFDESVAVSRIFCRPEQLTQARGVLDAWRSEGA